MGQFLSLALYNTLQNGVSMTSGFRTPHRAEAFQGVASNATQGLAVDLDHEWAQISRDEATLVAEEVEQMLAGLDNFERSALRGQGSTEAAVNAVLAEAARGAQEAQVERERARMMRRDAERVLAAAKQEAKRAQKAMEQLRREAEAGRALVEEIVRMTAQETRRAIGAKGETETHWKVGIEPVITLSPQELAATKKRVRFEEDCFHFAVAGVSGSGKSSLINAFRGLLGGDAGAAPVGTVEKVLKVNQYPDANPENPFVWYEIPGAGTDDHDWQYFNEQDVELFDSVIILFDDRLTVADIVVLANARLFNIPSYIVCSKADLCIQNIMSDMGCDSDNGDDADVERKNKLYYAARERFIEETKKSVQANLEDANLPDQRVYIVSSNMLLAILRNRISKKTIDEVELLHDLFNQVTTRRVAMVSDEMIPMEVGS